MIAYSPRGKYTVMNARRCGVCVAEKKKKRGGRERACVTRSQLTLRRRGLSAPAGLDRQRGRGGEKVSRWRARARSREEFWR